MPTCKECGSFIDQQVAKCPICGSKIKSSTTEESTTPYDKIVTEHDEASDLPIDEEIVHAPDIEYMEIGEDVPEEMLKSLHIVPQRNYFKWLAIGILTFGIGLMFYLYLSMEDLEKHSRYPNDLRAEPIKVDTSRLLLLFLSAIFCGFIPILWWIYHQKYASLYYHLKDQKEDKAPQKIIHWAFYMVPLVSSHLVALIPTIYGFATGINFVVTYVAIFWSLFGVVLALSITVMVLEFYWQKALNMHLEATKLDEFAPETQ
ncbi:MAG: RING finger protein [Candidatus Heimdallarchaeota archaeon]